MKIKKFNLWFFVNIVIFLALNIFLGKGMFSFGADDGFYTQVQGIIGISGDEWVPMFTVHLFRLFAVFPFFWLWQNGFPPIFETAVLLLIMYPVLTAEFNGRKRMLQVLFIYLPYAISFRSVLLTCSMAYLFILFFSDKKSYVLFILSALFANLSSGVVLAWLLIIAVNYRTVFKEYKAVMPVVVAMAMGFSYSLEHKMGFFAERNSAGNAMEEALMRSTLVVSYVYGQYGRLLFYSAIYLTLAFVFLYTFVAVIESSLSPKFLLFYFSALPGFFFEGLGIMAFIIPVGWFFLGVRPVRAGSVDGSADGRVCAG